ncbi:MAG: IS110 family transposase [Dysgonamonadaceae bacterium]|jgi:transposase|nr:IS110 family transposase [Dysgonamonadaceae bacterium]
MMVNVGIDLHKTQFTICVRTKSGNKFEKYPTTPEGIETFLKEVAAWQKGGKKVLAGVESTGNTRYFRDRLEEAGVKVTVINTLKLKVVTESVKKTDKHDAATIAEFLEKDMLPEARLCSRESEKLRRLIKARTTLVRAQVVMKNQIHGLLTAEGMEDVRGSLQSKKGRQQTLNALNQCKNGFEAQTLVETIEELDKNIKNIEKDLVRNTEGDRVVELLKSIPGCGDVCAWTIRAYADDIKRFASAKKFASYAGLAPWVQNSNESVHHGKITKRGPEELRTALVQVVMGLRRLKAKTYSWRMMERYAAMKKNKGSGRAIIATARKLATIIWHMLTSDVEFDIGQMIDRKLEMKSEAMRETVGLAEEAVYEKKEQPVLKMITCKRNKKTGVASRKRKKVS